jgi:hypothetical protein
MTPIGQVSTPKSWPCRTVYLTSYLVGVVLLAAYSAVLISFLAVTREAMPFETLHEMLKDETYNVMVPSGMELAFFRVSIFQLRKSTLNMCPHFSSCASASKCIKFNSTMYIFFIFTLYSPCIFLI